MEQKKKRSGIGRTNSVPSPSLFSNIFASLSKDSEDVFDDGANNNDAAFVMNNKSHHANKKDDVDVNTMKTPIMRMSEKGKNHNNKSKPHGSYPPIPTSITMRNAMLTRRMMASSSSPKAMSDNNNGNPLDCSVLSSSSSSSSSEDDDGIHRFDIESTNEDESHDFYNTSTCFARKRVVGVRTASATTTNTTTATNKRSLLIPVRLDIIVPGSVNDSSSNNSNSNRMEEQKLYSCSSTSSDTKSSNTSRTSSSSSSSSTPPLHPRWDHLNEKVDLFARYEEEKKKNTSSASGDGQEAKNKKKEKNDHHQLSDEMYRSMKARIVLISNDDEQQEQEQEEEIVLAELFLHPTSLRVLPPNNNNNNNNNDTSTTNTQIPSTLPPNAIFIHYTDGSIRISSDLHHLLLKRGIIRLEPETTNQHVREDMLAVERRTKRFSDAVFDVLDDPSSVERMESKVEQGQQEEQEDDDEVHFVPIGSDDKKHQHHHRSKSSPSQLSTGGKGDNNKKNKNPLTSDSEQSIAMTAMRVAAEEAYGSPPLFLDDAFHLLDDATKNVDVTSTSPVSSSSRDDGRNVETQQEVKNDDEAECEEEEEEKEDLNIVLPKASECRKNDLEVKLEHLKLLLKEEEEALEREKDLMKMKMDQLRQTKEQVKHIDDETNWIQQETKKEIEKASRLEFLLNARQIKLLRDLRLIYPLQTQSHPHTIRSLPLPHPLLKRVWTSSSSTENEISLSSALGFTCHLVSMTSKYLGVSLRYRLIPNSNRSAIQDDGEGVYPLFKERVVERRQLERGVILLERNVDCLLRMRSVIGVGRGCSILEKLNRLFVQLIEGG